MKSVYNALATLLNNGSTDMEKLEAIDMATIELYNDSKITLLEIMEKFRTFDRSEANLERIMNGALEGNHHSILRLICCLSHESAEIYAGLDEEQKFLKDKRSKELMSEIVRKSEVLVDFKDPTGLEIMRATILLD